MTFLNLVAINSSKKWYTFNWVGGKLRLKYLSEHLQLLKTGLKNSVPYCSNWQVQQLCKKTIILITHLYFDFIGKNRGWN